jgi:hypothetical protein
MPWLRNPNQNNIDNLRNERHEASRHFTNKKKECLEAKIDEFETVRSEISETCTGAAIILKGATSLELIQ